MWETILRLRRKQKSKMVTEPFFDKNSSISFSFYHSLLSLSESVYNSLQALHFLISGYLFPFKYFLIFRMAFFTKVPILRMKFSSFPENRSRIYPFRQITRRAESA